MAVEVAAAYVSLIPEAKGFGSGLDSALGGSIADVGKKHGDLFSSGLLGVLKDNAGKLAAVLGTALTVGSVVEIGKGLFKLGATFDEAFDKIRVTTGATGKDLGLLEDSFKTVFSDVPTDADSASTAIATLNQKLGLTGKPLESLSEQLINLSRITGTDLKTNIGATVDVFNSFGVAAADQPKKLDELFRASQKTGVGVGDLASTMAQAGPNLKQLGLNFEQSAALVAIFGKAGVDVGAVLPALSKTIVQAAKDGKNAGDVFKDTFAAIKNAPSDTEAAGAAIDVFGAKAGPKLAGLIREGKLSYEELAQSIADGGDTINQAASDTADFAEKWGTFKNQILVGLEPLATAVFSGVGNAMEKLGPIAAPVIARITDGLLNMFSGAEGSISAFVAAFKSGGDGITSSGFNGAMEGAGEAASKLYDWLGVQIPKSIDLLKAAFDQAQERIGATVSYVEDHKDAFATIAAGAAAFASALAVIGTAQTGITNFTSALSLLATAAAAGPFALAAALIIGVGVAAFVAYKKIQPIHEVFDTIGRTVRDIAVPAFEGFMTAVGAVRDNAGPVFDKISGAIGTAKDAIVAIAGAIRTSLQPEIDWIGQNVAPTVSEAFGAIGAIVGRFVDLMGTITNIVQAVAGVFGTILEPQVRLLRVAFQLIGANIRFVFDMMMAGLTFLGPLWTTFSRIIADVVVTAFNQVKATVEEVLGIFRGFFQIIKGLFSGDWSQVWEGVKTIFSSAWGFIIDTIKNAVTLILQIVSDIDFAGFIAKIAALPGLVGTALLDLGKALMDGLLAGLNAVLSSVLQFFLELPGKIIDVVKALFGIGSPSTVFAAIGSDILLGLLQGLGSVVGAVASFFLGLPGQILGWLGSLASLLVGAGSDAIQGLINGIQNVIGEVISFFSNLPGNIVSWLGSLGSLLYDHGRDALQGLLNGISSIVGNVSSFFSNLPGNIASWLGYLGSLLTGAGGDVISGFINGIESWIGSIAGHIASIPGHVTGAIGYLGDLLYGKGQEIVRGLIDGIESLAGAAESAAERVVSAAARAAAASIPGAGAIGFVVDHLAAGGLVTKPTLAIVGESGPEVVIPLNMFPGRASPLPPAYAAGMPVSAAAGSSGGNVVVNAQTNADAWQIASEVRWAQKTAGV